MTFASVLVWISSLVELCATFVIVYHAARATVAIVRSADIDQARALIAEGVLSALGFSLCATLLKVIGLQSWGSDSDVCDGLRAPNAAEASVFAGANSCAAANGIPIASGATRSLARRKPEECGLRLRPRGPLRALGQSGGDQMDLCAGGADAPGEENAALPWAAERAIEIRFRRART